MVTYVFPGQGSQKVGMGKELFPLFQSLTKQADDVLGYSIVELCTLDPKQQLQQTQYTQPALYVVNALAYYQRLQTDALKPCYVAGHSLGEYNALLAAEVFDFVTGLKLVQKRGELMAQARNGGMAAVIGLSEIELKRILRDHTLTTLAIANYNSYNQIVIAGPQTVIERAQEIFTAFDAVYFFPLKTSGAFHSTFMSTAQQQFANFIQSFEFAKPTIEVIANVTAQPYPENNLAPLLVQQITHPVRWLETIEYILTHGETDIRELGPGNVLTKIISKIRRKQ